MFVQPFLFTQGLEINVFAIHYTPCFDGEIFNHFMMFQTKAKEAVSNERSPNVKYLVSEHPY